MNTITSLDNAECPPVMQSRHLLRPESTFVARLGELRMLRREWDGLAMAADSAPLYLTYTYCELIAASLFIKGRQIVIVRIFAGSELVALWPLTIERRGLWRIVTHLSCGNHEEYAGPLIRTNVDHQTITDAALNAAMKLPADVLELHFVQDGSWLHHASIDKPQPRFVPDHVGRWGASSIALRQFGKIDEYYQIELSSGLRRNLKRQMKALQTHGMVEIGWCTSPDDMQLILTWLFENKRRWANARGIDTPWLQKNGVRDFHLELARKVDLTLAPMVAYIKLDGVPIAASLSWVGSRVHEWCITTYDATYHRHGVGVLLLEFLVAWSHEHKLDFDFRFFEADYKDRWANLHSTQKTRYLFLNRYGKLNELQMLAIGAIGSLRFRRRRLMHNMRARITKMTTTTTKIDTSGMQSD